MSRRRHPYSRSGRLSAPLVGLLVVALLAPSCASGMTTGDDPKADAAAYYRIASSFERERRQLEGRAARSVAKDYARCAEVRRQPHSADIVLDRYLFWTGFRRVAPGYRRTVARLAAVGSHDRTLLSVLAQARIIYRTLTPLRNIPLPPICRVVERYVRASDQGGFLFRLNAKYIPHEAERERANAKVEALVPRLQALALTFDQAEELRSDLGVGTP
ncbi:MAG: hypothetical protein ACXVRZ_18070 [Gaiellaceae bacterium]